MAEGKKLTALFAVKPMQIVFLLKLYFGNIYVAKEKEITLILD